MSAKAGEGFICVCCGEEHDAQEAVNDQQLRGPVCGGCHYNLVKAVVYLKRHDIGRPLKSDDVNQFNFKRFMDHK